MPWSAEAAREHRAYRKSLNRPVKRGAAEFCLFDQGQFVAIDGEGFNEGRAEKFTLAGRLYRARPHHYGLLATSLGAQIVAADGGYLGTAQCLDFLIDQAGPQRVLVGFGLSYDFTHWLIDLPRDAVVGIMQGYEGRFGRKYADFTLSGFDYRVELQMRKCFRVWRWPAGAAKYEEHKPGKWRSTCEHRAVVWDSWGFFQGTFVAALKEWLPDHPDTPLIIKMKERRSTFTRRQMDVIRRYNDKELQLLCLMMERVRTAVQGMGLKLTRYDGAGAIAAAMFKRYDVKAHKDACPPAVFEAARGAYSGGHIEMYMLGHAMRYVFHADINSAYPYWLAQVPSLAGAVWHHWTREDGGNDPPPAGFTLVRVRYSFHHMPFYPLFYREENGSILYPRMGTGWHWFPEYDVARQFAELHGADYFEVLEWWHCHPASNHLPFDFVREAFEQRRSMIMEDRTAGRPVRGETKTLKLGYNACSGKTAQQVGARHDADGGVVPPAYFQIEWAGYVTAGTRAQVMAAAMQKPHAIIGVATDGIYATEPLTLDVSTIKELGKWEVTEHKGITMVMPGVYWLHDAEAQTTAHSRGFEQRFLEDHRAILAAWKAGRTLVDVPVTRLITLGSALASEAMWGMRGRFVDSVRMLKINGDNSKRYSHRASQAPHRGLVSLEPQQQWLGFIHDDDDLESALYPIDWLEPEPVGDGVWGELGDAEAEGDVEGDIQAAELALW